MTISVIQISSWASWPLGLRFYMTFDLYFGAKVHFSHYIQCKLQMASVPKLYEQHPNGLHQYIAYVKHFQSIGKCWPWSFFQGHGSQFYVWNINLKTWHVSFFVGLEIQYHACRHIYHRSTYCAKLRSVWPL